MRYLVVSWKSSTVPSHDTGVGGRRLLHSHIHQRGDVGAWVLREVSLPGLYWLSARGETHLQGVPDPHDHLQHEEGRQDCQAEDEARGHHEEYYFEENMVEGRREIQSENPSLFSRHFQQREIVFWVHCVVRVLHGSQVFKIFIYHLLRHNDLWLQSVVCKGRAGWQLHWTCWQWLVSSGAPESPPGPNKDKDTGESCLTYCTSNKNISE